MSPFLYVALNAKYCRMPAIPLPVTTSRVRTSTINSQAYVLANILSEKLISARERLYDNTYKLQTCRYLFHNLSRTNDL